MTALELRVAALERAAGTKFAPTKMLLAMKVAAEAFAPCPNPENWMRGRGRSEPAATARMVAMRLCVLTLGMPTADVAWHFRRSWAATRHAIHTTADRIETGRDFAERYAAAQTKLENAR